jgi:hypothetical protein
MDPVVAATLAGAVAGVAVSAAGWVVSYKFTLKAQRASTRDQLVNAARLEVTASLHDAQRWLSRVNAGLSMFPILVDLERKEFVTQGQWHSVLQDLRSLSDDALLASRWQGHCEIYATLFPRMVECRVGLGHRQRLVARGLVDIIADLQRSLSTCSSVDDRDALAQRAPALQQVMYDQAALYEDLKIHLQNHSLAEITGRRVPTRRGDPELPHIIESDEGTLLLIIPEGAPRLD